MTSNVDVETIDPLESLGEFSIDEINILESIDPNDLTEWIEDASDSVNEEQDTKSIDPDDLKEWLEVMSCEGDSELLGELQKDGKNVQIQIMRVMIQFQRPISSVV